MLSSAPLQAQAPGLEKERDRWLEEIKQYNLSGSNDVRLWETLQSNFTFEEQRTSEAYSQAEKGSLAFFAQVIKFTEECLVESRRLTPMVVPAVVAVRKELGIPIDAQNYGGIINVALAKQEADMAEFLDSARQAVGQP